MMECAGERTKKGRYHGVSRNYNQLQSKHCRDESKTKARTKPRTKPSSNKDSFHWQITYQFIFWKIGHIKAKSDVEPVSCVSGSSVF